MELRTHGLSLRLDSSPPDADGWFACVATVEVPGFSGVFPCWLQRPELELFQRQLLAMLQQEGVPSVADLNSIEPGIDLHLASNRSGQIRGRYSFQNFDSPGQPMLSGEFEMDLSYVPGLLSQIATLLREAT
jgi:hypothetical protein